MQPSGEHANCNGKFRCMQAKFDKMVILYRPDSSSTRNNKKSSCFDAFENTITFPMKWQPMARRKA